MSNPVNIKKYCAIWEKTGLAFFKFAESHALVMILLVVLINLALKSYKIGESSIWCDEGLSIQYAQMGIREILDVHKNDSNPPLYACVLSVWNIFSGNSEAGLRSLSMIFSLFTAVMLYIFALKHLNIQSAVYVSLLFAFSNIHLYYSHEIRTYALTGELCSLSIFLFYELIKFPNLYKLAALGVVNALLIHSHYITPFFLIVECIAALSFYTTFKKGFKYYVFSQALALLLIMPWLLYIKLNGYPSAGDISWLSKPSMAHIFYVFADFSNGKFFVFAYLIIMLACAISMWKENNNKPGLTDRQNIAFLALFAFFPVISVFLVSFIQPVFNVRYVLYASLGLFLLMAYLLSLAPWKISFKLAIIGCLVFASLFRLHFSTNKGEDWNRAVPYIKAHKTDSDVVVVSASYLYPCFAYYYNLDYLGDHKNTLSHLKSEKVYCMNDVSGLSKIDYKGLNRIFLIQGHQVVADPKNTLFNTCNEQFKLEFRTNFAALKLSVFQCSP